MARTRTLQEMREEAIQRAAMENSTFVVTAEVNRRVNQRIAQLYGKLVRARGDEYYAVKATPSTVAGVDTVALAAAFFKLLYVSAKIGGRWVPLERFELQEADDYQDSSWNLVRVPRYRTMGGNLLLRPVPDGVFELQVWYVPHATVLVADGDTFDGINGWEDYVTIGTAIDLKAKEESDTKDLQVELARMDAEITALADTRDEGQPARIRDVRRSVPWPGDWELD